jgi:hypothetical protein
LNPLAERACFSQVRAQVYFATAERLQERFAELRGQAKKGGASPRLSKEEVLELAADCGFALETEGAREAASAAMDADLKGSVDMFDFEDWWKGKWMRYPLYQAVATADILADDASSPPSGGRAGGGGGGGGAAVAAAAAAAAEERVVESLSGSGPMLALAKGQVVDVLDDGGGAEEQALWLCALGDVEGMVPSNRLETGSNR